MSMSSKAAKLHVVQAWSNIIFQCQIVLWHICVVVVGKILCLTFQTCLNCYTAVLLLTSCKNENKTPENRIYIDIHSLTYTHSREIVRKCKSEFCTTARFHQSSSSDKKLILVDCKIFIFAIYFNSFLSEVH